MIQLLETIARLPHVPAAFMVTSSALARGVVTAMSWFLPAPQCARTFRLDELDHVLALLDLDASAREAVKLAVHTLMGILAGRVDTSATRGG